MVSGLVPGLVRTLVAGLVSAPVSGLVATLVSELAGTLGSKRTICTAWGRLILPIPEIARDQKIAGGNQVRNPHAFFPHIAAGLGNIPPQSHRVFKLGRKGKDAQQVPVLEQPGKTRCVQRELFHTAAVMALNPLQQDSLGSRQAGQPACTFQGLSLIHI